MDMKEIKEAKKTLEEAICKLVDDFELKSDLIVEEIHLKRLHIKAGIRTRDALDKVTIRAALPLVTA